MKLSKLLYSFIGTAGLQVIGIGLNVIIGICLARVLQPDGYGTYSYVISIVMVTMIPVSAGLSQLLIREVARYELRGEYQHVKGVCVWSSNYILASSAIMILVVWLMLQAGIFEKSLFSLLMVGLLLVPCRSFLTRSMAILNAHRFPVQSQIVNSIFIPLLFLGFVSVFMMTDRIINPFMAMLIQVFTVFSGCIAITIMLQIKRPDELNSVKAVFQYKAWYKALIPFSLMVIVVSLNNEVCTIVLGNLSSKESVAYFKVAMQGVNIVAIGQSAVNTVIGPHLARLCDSGENVEAQQLINKSVRLGFVVSLPVLLLLLFYGEPLICLLFGIEYAPSVGVLYCLIIGQFVNVVTGSVGLILNVTGNEKDLLKAASVAFIVNIVFLLILVPSYQEKGAGAAFAVSMAVWNVLMAYDVKVKTGLISWVTWR